MLPAICISCPFMLDEDGMSAVTMWIAGDFETDSGRRLLLGALKHVVSMSSSLFFFPPIQRCYVIKEVKFTLKINFLCVLTKNINTDASEMKFALFIHHR